MSLETNKIAGAILLAGIVTMGVTKISDALYQPEQAQKRGYTIEGATEAAAVGSGEGADNKKAGAAVDILAYLGAADIASGEKIFKTKCTTCHTAEQGGAHKMGPNLWGVVGSAKGGSPGFSYSPAMQEKGGSWGFQELSEFLTKPAKYVKGTRMAFAGIKKPEKRANLIAYLNSLGSNKPIPAYTPPDETTDTTTEQTTPPAELP